MFNPLTLIPAKAGFYLKLGLVAAAVLLPLITYGCGRIKGRELAENAFAAQALEDFETMSKLKDQLDDARAKAAEDAALRVAAERAAADKLTENVDAIVRTNPTNSELCRATSDELEWMRDFANEGNRSR